MSPLDSRVSTNLGNFLSGMETWRRQLWKIGETVLGNFLSGMETSPASRERPWPARLGNFLSGMETPSGLRGLRRRARPLETSLVEWKLPLSPPPDAPEIYLGNFLSGMETRTLPGATASDAPPWKLP